MKALFTLFMEANDEQDDESSDRCHFACEDCGNVWDAEEDDPKEDKCPRCGSTNVIDLDDSFGDDDDDEDGDTDNSEDSATSSKSDEFGYDDDDENEGSGKNRR